MSSVGMPSALAADVWASVLRTRLLANDAAVTALLHRTSRARAAQPSSDDQGDTFWAAWSALVPNAFRR